MGREGSKTGLEERSLEEDVEDEAFPLSCRESDRETQEDEAEELDNDPLIGAPFDLVFFIWFCFCFAAFIVFFHFFNSAFALDATYEASKRSIEAKSYIIYE